MLVFTGSASFRYVSRYINMLAIQHVGLMSHFYVKKKRNRSRDTPETLHVVFNYITYHLIITSCVQKEMKSVSVKPEVL